MEFIFTDVLTLDIKLKPVYILLTITHKKYNGFYIEIVTRYEFKTDT